ncbi:GAP family protein [Mycobacterium vicinigordonae]|uniref:GAP family protein n=1 Tax=Mycobacterium vicinigordonae TaxID=1719132 RepID=A0A7D6E2W5_9MYCO|nr:GAP family protein [Mycobacterium vicinigordonae]QLL05723.1 GAP family protein [Mycobacterium vicinigordonae]
MWVPILVMAVAVSLEPFRIAMTVLMLNRPRPVLQLLAFLSGGFAMGVTVGLSVIFILRRRLVASGQLTGPRVQVLIGGLALFVAAVLAITVVVDRIRGGAGARSAGIERATAVQRLPVRFRQLLTGPSLWVAAVAGLGIALPSVDYLAALAVILTSGAAVITQVAALLLFNVTAFAMVEISFVACLLAPDATRRVMTALNSWVGSRRRIEVAALLTAVGCVLLAVGFAGL